MELSLDELVVLVGGTLLTGDGATRLTGVATLEEAGPSDLSFYGVAKYRPQFDATKAGAVLVPPDVESGPAGAALIQVENPSLALAALARMATEKARSFAPGIAKGALLEDGAEVDPGASVKAGAVVEAGAVVGAGTEIGAGAVIGRGARIGKDCLIHQNVTVRDGCIIGDRVVLQSGAVIGSDGYGFEFAEGKHHKVPQIGIVVVEDDVEIGANTCVDRARFGKTVIGQGSKIDNLVQVGHNVRIGKHCLLVAGCAIAGSSKLNDYVTIAGQSGVSGHIEIASGVQIAGMSGVHNNMPEAGAYLGVPARPVKQAVAIWRATGKLPETTKEVKALRKELEELRARLEE